VTAAQVAAGTVVRLAGRVDATTVALHRDRLHHAVDSGSGAVVVDLAQVEVLDATGVGMLLGAARRAARSGRPLVLRGTPIRVARMLHVTGIDRILRPEGAGVRR
jgi:anti-anti-sigma factor